MPWVLSSYQIHDMTYTMKRHTDNRLSMLSLGRMKTQVMMLLMLMMLLGAGGNMSAQTYETGELDEGFYYIVHNQDKTFSLCPAEDPSDNTKGRWYESTTANGKPLLTTNKNVPDDYRLWHLTKNGDGNYQIVHAKDGKYVINDKTDKVLEAAHIDMLPDGGTNTWFAVSYVTGSYYNIKGTGVSGNYSFNPYSGNKEAYGNSSASNTGIIGYWDNNNDGSKWQFVKVLPVISKDGGSFTISFSPEISGQLIYYTTDNSDPRSSSTRQTYSSSFSLTGDDTKVKATVELHGHYSEVVIYNTVHCATPVITNTDGVISITCATAGASIYYTTDKSTPTPSSTLFTSLTLPLNTNVEQIKAIAVLDDDYSDISEVATLNINKCATPNITANTTNGDVTMTSTTGATIRYTTNGNNPGTGSTVYSTPTALLPEGTAIEQIKAIAYKACMRPSDIKTYDVPRCETPVITNSDGTITITCATTGSTIHYATSTNGEYSNYTSSFALGSAPIVKAYASHAGYCNSLVASITGALTEVSSTDVMTDMNGNYKLAANFTVNGHIGTPESPFTGVIDGQFNTISSTSAPLVAYANGAIIRNVVIGTAGISGGTNVGAICNEAAGATRIYNCGVQGGTVSGTGYVGSIVGKLDGTSRVINCYSFANVSGGTDVGGIVGYNNVSGSNANGVTTMVMNCMFYGNATGTNISPIYGGNINENSGSTALNNFNYYSFKDFTSTVTEGKYNCALGAEERFLTRFEFYRHILNSNRELAAWYVNGSTASSRDVIAKWVLDKSVKPYPILKTHDKYTSIINYDASAGESLGTLSVTISGTGTNAPTGASLTTSSLTLTRTNKDPDNFNFNYDKVQLPYYNDIGTGNYTDNKVVTGWEITVISGSGTTNYSTGSDVTVEEGKVTATPYNFADRNCTGKDLYATSGRIFSQGAYFDVPNGVTAITIQPHWAKAAYLSDPNYDRTYNNGSTAYNITAMGTRYINNTNYTINGSSQKVYTDMNSAINALSRPSGCSVYDYAVVLVGNYHHYYGNNQIKNDDNGFTIMSADLDGDNEPDNCFFYQHQQRQPVSPIRFDFLCWPGIGMAQKPSDMQRMPGIGIFKPRRWFEVTNTCIAHFYEVEYSWKDHNAASPLILLGGVYEQIVSSNDGAPNNTIYIHLGSNVWFKMFNNGIHADKKNFTPHNPISVTGGDYDKFYLSGMFRPDADATADNAECYISGGRFGEVAGAGMEKINGNVYWQIDHADIEAFYGGGINDAQPVQGNITTDIRGSRITTFCGGPKFGDMASGKKVKTTATNCTFGKYFGAGYGGTSLNRIRKRNYVNAPNYDFNGWATNANHGYKRQYETTTSYGTNNNGDPNGSATVNAISTNYEYELFAYAGFADNNNVGRFYVNFASLSLATTGDVSSTLTDCTITDNFYGGGNLGKVDGNITSTLTDCTVQGNAFGAGFSASAPTVEVMAKAGFTTVPHFDGNSGTYTQGVFPATTRYTWKHADTALANGDNPFEDDGDNHYILTTADMSSLGTVTGTVSLTIGDDSKIGTVDDAKTGNVYGGGDESAVSNTTTPANASTIVTLQGNTEVLGNVFGGGNEGVVSGTATVNIQP